MSEGERVEAGWRVMTYRRTPRCVRIPSAPPQFPHFDLEHTSQIMPIWHDRPKMRCHLAPNPMPRNADKRLSASLI